VALVFFSFARNSHYVKKQERDGNYMKLSADPGRRKGERARE
jgi:hypothetical protein